MCLFAIIEHIIGSIIFLGLMTYGVLSIIYKNINSSRIPVIVSCREFIKTFLRLLFSRRTYDRINYNKDAVIRGDAYIDKLLQDMFKDRLEYDPYEIEDSVIGFNKKVLFVNITGEAKLHNGYIKGLSTLHRPNHCSLSEDGERLLVVADLGAGQLDFSYAGSVKFMNFGPTITVYGILSYIGVHMEFTVDSKTGKEGKLEKFIIDDMRGMNVWITGLGPLNWAVNPIISGVTKIFKRFVRNFMENKVEKHITERIPKFQFPVEGSKEIEDPVTSDRDESKETNRPVPETTSKPELDTTSEQKFENTKVTSKPELETTNGEVDTSEPELETVSEEVEDTNKPELETSSTEQLEEKKPDLETSSTEQLEGKPDLETSSTERLEEQKSDLDTSSTEQLEEKKSYLDTISTERLEEKKSDLDTISTERLEEKKSDLGTSSTEQLEEKKPDLETSSTEQKKSDLETSSTEQLEEKPDIVKSSMKFGEENQPDTSERKTTNEEKPKEEAEALSKESETEADEEADKSGKSENSAEGSDCEDDSMEHADSGDEHSNEVVSAEAKAVALLYESYHRGR